MDSSSRIEKPIPREDGDLESQQIPQNPLESHTTQGSAFPGYLNLSALMACNDSFAIFRGFGDLNLLNLLCLQAELANLRAEFLTLAAASTKNDLYSEKNFFDNNNPIDFNTFVKDGSSQREVVERIRAKLKEYNSALLEFAQMKKLEPPDPQMLSLFRSWLATRREGNTTRESASPWDEIFSDDLILLSGEAQIQSSMIHDLLYKGQELLTSASRIFSSQKKEESPSAIWESVRDSDAKVDQQIAFTNRLIMALFGGVALIVPVLIMAFHPTRNTCLTTTTVATLLFALILAFEARDSRGKDVLTATAAYAAVLVVFIGTSLPGGSGCGGG